MISVRFKDTIRERIPEWIASFALVAWGLILLTEGSDLWDQGYFDALTNIASQQIWGTLSIIVGLIRCAVLGINGAWRPTAHMRALGALLGVLLWSGIVMSYINLDWNPPALASMGAMLTLDISALWFAAGDAKLADIKAYEQIQAKKLEAA